MVAGCSAPSLPEVTFYSSGKTVNVRPTQYCDLESENCVVDAGAVGVLRVRPGLPVQISVPGEVADSAWSVKFTYRDGDGVGQEPLRSKVFTSAEPRYAYTLELPAADDQLESVEVQQFGKRVQIDETGQIEFVARGTWVLSVDDRG
ncbi:DUF2771 domain-containing protein [Umezawaea endophytica]|uniref:DUF2771 domain-containing protein n=1 Tax=Umezawaea endophytica TaxID=1654476 RepID=A0A9X2VMN2_9PSEU|nr:DUF2771 domain-containing protein [Umezawaea endophytica]